jgi:hypothetical protein
MEFNLMISLICKATGLERGAAIRATTMGIYNLTGDAELAALGTLIPADLAMTLIGVGVQARGEINEIRDLDKLYELS